MLNLDWNIVGTLLVALGGLSGLGGLIQVIYQRKKFRQEADRIGADATQIITDTATGLLVAARRELGEIQEDHDILREDFDYAMEQIRDYVDTISHHIFGLESTIRQYDPMAVIPGQPPRPRLRRPRTNPPNAA